MTGSTPSGNAMAVTASLKLATLTDRLDLGDIAEGYRNRLKDYCENRRSG